MATDKKAIRVYVTDNQLAAAEQLALALADKPSEQSVSALVKRMLKEACERQGIDWIEDESGWGGKRH